MSLNLSNPSQKQTLLAIVGIVVLVVILAIVGSMYGRFLKTQVAPGGTTYSATGNLKADVLEPGTYTLKFTGRDVETVTSQAMRFGITTGSMSATPTPNASATSTPISTPTTTPTLPY